MAHTWYMTEATTRTNTLSCRTCLVLDVNQTQTLAIARNHNGLLPEKTSMAFTLTFVLVSHLHQADQIVSEQINTEINSDA